MAAEVEGLSYANAAHLARTSTPWWGTGTSSKETVYDHWLSDDEVKAEIGFDVDVRPLFRLNDEGVYVPVEDSQETVRLDWSGEGANRRVKSKHIATVGSDYKPFPGVDLVDFGSEIVENYGEKWDTAGRLRGDRIIFGTIRLDHLIETGALENFDGSEYFNWLLLATSHDGSMALQAAVVKVRTVCKNTFVGGLSSAKSTFSIRHTGDIDGRAREAARALSIVTKADAEFERVAHQLAETDFNVEQFEALTEELFPITNDHGDRAKKNRLEARAGVTSNWLTTPTVTDGLRFTKWGALNGVTEWAEHKRPVRNIGDASERRLLSTAFGGPVQKIREQAVKVLTRV